MVEHLVLPAGIVTRDPVDGADAVAPDGVHDILELRDRGLDEDGVSPFTVDVSQGSHP